MINKNAIFNKLRTFSAVHITVVIKVITWKDGSMAKKRRKNDDSIPVSARTLRVLQRRRR